MSTSSPLHRVTAPLCGRSAGSLGAAKPRGDSSIVKEPHAELQVKSYFASKNEPMRFSRFVTSFAACVLAACATPLRPDPSVDLTGDWRVTAVNGMDVPPGMSGFRFRYEPPFSLASLGCNSGSGPARVAHGWLVTGDGWIITTARCSEERMRFSRYELFSEPLAIEAAGGGLVQLRNAR